MPDVPDDAVKLAEHFEGFSATPYQDSTGVWTIGYGTTRDLLYNPVTKNTSPVTPDLAEGLMRRDLRAALSTVTDDVKVPLTYNEEAALVDFIYNVGSGNFAASTLLRKLNAGDYPGAAAELLRWTHAGGVVLAGLVLRRQAEREEFMRGQSA